MKTSEQTGAPADSWREPSHAISALPAVGCGLGLILVLVITTWWFLAGGAPPRAKDQPFPAGQDVQRRSAAGPDDPYSTQREAMINDHLLGRDITDRRVLDAMRSVPRHKFVPPSLRDMAYADRALPIGNEQTISQPYIVALMTQLAQVKPGARVLDIGTGSGYQAAVLAQLSEKVYSIEIVESLADEARRRLADLDYENVTVRTGDGYQGWSEHAPFDAIIVAAAPDHVPPALVQQLAPGARLVIPLGTTFQQLTVVEKQPDGSARQWVVAPVAFVPMTGEAEDR